MNLDRSYISVALTMLAVVVQHYILRNNKSAETEMLLCELIVTFFGTLLAYGSWVFPYVVGAFVAVVTGIFVYMHPISWRKKKNKPVL